MTNKKTMIKIIMALALGVSILSPNVKVKAMDKSVERVWGMDRFETAIEVSNKFVNTPAHFNARWPQGKVDTVILANGYNYPDALSAAPLTKLYNAPILLSGAENLELKTEAQLKKLGIKKVVMIGGNGVLSENVENRLKELGIETERIGGQDRYETSMKIAHKLPNVKKIILTTTKNFTDALSATPISIRSNAPIILIPDGKDIKLDDIKGLKEYINNKTNGEKNIPMEQFSSLLIGSKDTVNYNLGKEIPNTVLGGATNAFRSNFNLNYSEQAVLTFDNVIMPSTIDFADALSGSALAGKLNAPIVFAGGNNDDIFISDSTKNLILRLYGVTNKVYLLGGSAVVPEGAEHKIEVYK